METGLNEVWTNSKSSLICMETFNDFHSLFQRILLSKCLMLTIKNVTVIIKKLTLQKKKEREIFDHE